MKVTKLVLIVIGLVTFFCVAINGHGTHATGYYMSPHSFKPPFAVDQGVSAVENWEIRGSSQINEQFVRLTPATENRAGYMTNKKPYTHSSVELTMEVHIHSDGPQGADGMGLWLTQQPITSRGPVYGGPEIWEGLLVVLDTYDNDGSGEHPMLMLHYNDGSSKFEFNHDGAPTFIDGCSINYRNQPKSYIHLFIEHNYISIYIDEAGNGEWKQCVEPVGLHMPDKYYFSISAATGGLTDNHDIYSFIVNSLEETALVLYKPENGVIEQARKEIAKQVDEMEAKMIFNSDEEIAPECVTKNECINFDTMRDIVDQMEDFKDGIAHKMFEIETSVLDNIKDMSYHFELLNVSMIGRQAEMNQLRVTLQDGTKDFHRALNTVQRGKPSVDKFYTKLKDSISNMQRLAKELQSEQESTLQALDIETSIMLDQQNSSFWLIVAFLLVVIQFVLSLITSKK